MIVIGHETKRLKWQQQEEYWMLDTGEITEEEEESGDNVERVKRGTQQHLYQWKCYHSAKSPKGICEDIGWKKVWKIWVTARGSKGGNWMNKHKHWLNQFNGITSVLFMQICFFHVLDYKMLFNLKKKYIHFTLFFFYQK